MSTEKEKLNYRKLINLGASDVLYKIRILLSGGFANGFRLINLVERLKQQPFYSADIGD